MLSRLKYLLLICSALFMACKNEIQEAMEAESNIKLPTEIIYDANISYSSGGRITSRLFSPEIKRYAAKDTSYVLMNKGFKATFYDSLGNFESELTAEKGIWYESRKIMIGERNVVFKNFKGEILNTEKLTWLQDSARIVTDKAIRIVKPDGVIYGQGLSAAEDFSSYTIQKITGELYVDDKDLENQEDSVP